LERLAPVSEEEEQEGGGGFRPLKSVQNLFARPRGSGDDGIIAFRKCHSYQGRTEPVERERYALADDIFDDEESIINFSKSPTAKDAEENPLGIEDDGTAKTEETDEGDFSGDKIVGQLVHIVNTCITEPKTPSFLDNLCPNLCGIFSLHELRKLGKPGGSSVVSLSDETMPEDGGIFVVRNGAVREIDLGEDIADTDEQLGRETSNRSRPGKRIEQSTKHVSDKVVRKAEGAGQITLDGIARVVKAMASTLTQEEDVEKDGDTCRDKNDEDEEDVTRTAEAREHANMVKYALNEIIGGIEQSIDPNDTLQSRGSF
jgi:hypothetical protein